MPCGKKRKRHKIATHKRKKRLRKNRHKKKNKQFFFHTSVFPMKYACIFPNCTPLIYSATLPLPSFVKWMCFKKYKAVFAFNCAMRALKKLL